MERSFVLPSGHLCNESFCRTFVQCARTLMSETDGWVWFESSLESNPAAVATIAMLFFAVDREAHTSLISRNQRAADDSIKATRTRMIREGDYVTFCVGSNRARGQLLLATKTELLYD
ncbi:hypothetical protein L596_005516 [Steinernema carpocapsae]|uniref:Uncharacterized protein n=1 Tax=Steinernema carpocapsae TaxID=34508 RepID=A0A4U8UZI4_STECR|nr:hypothetical protein L596_005516 [Steinernema carpocapsae]